MMGQALEMQTTRLREVMWRILALLHTPPWDPSEVIAFEQFWRPSAEADSSPCP